MRMCGPNRQTSYMSIPTHECMIFAQACILEKEMSRLGFELVPICTVAVAHNHCDGRVRGFEIINLLLMCITQIIWGPISCKYFKLCIDHQLQSFQTWFEDISSHACSASNRGAISGRPHCCVARCPPGCFKQEFVWSRYNCGRSRG
jgi:hypothetical protein